MIKERCDLEVINDDKTECRAICLKYFDDRCCKFCMETWKCNRVCGWVKQQRVSVK